MDPLSVWNAEPADVAEACRVEFELDGVRSECDGLDVADVPFESLTERSCLLELDRMSTLTGVSSQPMWITWLHSGHRHAPDFFVRDVDGTGVVIDVRPLARIDDRAREQFGRTARLCAALGLRYCVYSPSSSVRDANLRFLMRYRDPRWLDPRAAQMLPRGDHMLGDCVNWLGALEFPLATCYALLWAGDLVADLERPLSMRMRVEWRGGA